MAKKFSSLREKMSPESVARADAEAQELLKAMQTTRSRRGARKAFNASPAELGAVAVETATRGKSRS